MYLRHVWMPLTAAAVGALGIIAAAPSTARVNIAYDQISRYLADATPPPPNSFAEDAARIAALPPMPDAKPMNSAIDTAMAASSNPLLSVTGAGYFLAMAAASAVNAYNAKMSQASKAYMLAGVMDRVWFYRDWSRIDSDQGVLITKPDQGLVVDLNPAKHIYHEAHTAGPSSQPGVTTYSLDEPTAEAGEPDVTYISSPVIERLPTMMIAGHLARGYQTDARLSLASSLGRCSAGEHTLTETEYVVDVPDPQTAKGPPKSARQAAGEACSPSTLGSIHEPGKLVVFQSIVVGDSQSGKSVVMVLERDHIRTIDASQEQQLFTIPADYTKE